MRLANNTYAIQGLFTLSPWIVNSGFIVGQNKTLIIDSGANYISAQTILGYAKCASGDNEFIIVNTEPHFDHIGGNCYFAELDIPILGHAEINRTMDEFVGLKAEYNRSITSKVRREKHEEEHLFWKTSPVSPSVKIKDQITKIELGGIDIELILTPGHSPQNLVVWSKDEKILFAGDTIIQGYIPNMEDSTVEGWQDWLNSLDLIEKLNPNILIPGHGNILREAEIKEQINITRMFLERGLREGKAPTAS